MTIRQREPAASVIILTDEPSPCYMRPRLPAFLSGALSEEQLLVSGFIDYVARNIELQQRPAVGIDFQAHRVELRGGKSLPWDALLLATGSRPRPLPVEGGGGNKSGPCRVFLRGVTHCAFSGPQGLGPQTSKKEDLPMPRSLPIRRPGTRARHWDSGPDRSRRTPQDRDASV